MPVLLCPEGCGRLVVVGRKGARESLYGTVAGPARHRCNRLIRLGQLEGGAMEPEAMDCVCGRLAGDGAIDPVEMMGRETGDLS